jgi:predicted RNase H-like nuclease
VFSTPIRAALEAGSLPDAVTISRRETGAGISAQAYALRSRVLEVDGWVRSADVDVREAHPEVSFAVMAGRPVATSKKSWNGLRQRLALLAGQGIDLGEDLGPAGEAAGIDDVVDAAAVAWTAARILTGDAISLPSPPEDLDGRPAAIWA